MKIYMGIKKGPGPQDVVVFYTDGSHQTRPLRHIMRHSPDGFQWGYGGSGPADLALSILCDCIIGAVPALFDNSTLNPKLAEKYYQLFKRKFIEPADRQLYIKESDLMRWISEKEDEARA